MAAWNYAKGLHDLGHGVYAYLQPDGSWGWSNAGLVIDGDQSLLVDTLFDEIITAEMLDVMHDATGKAATDITTLVNTHANGDHTYGNRLISEAEIIASRASADEMAEFPPEMLADLLREAPQLGALGRYLEDSFAAFDFDGIGLALPSRTFSGRLDLTIGDKPVHLIEVGPAHTRGDVLVHVPDDRVVYTGDILFIESTPVMWAGPVRNWLDALDLIVDLDVAAIVPGHGPITDKAGVRRVHDYLSYIDQEARKRYNAGLSARDAAFDIALADYGSWGDAERIAVNVDTLYREYEGDTSPPDILQLFALMAAIRHR